MPGNWEKRKGNLKEYDFAGSGFAKKKMPARDNEPVKMSMTDFSIIWSLP